MRMVWYGSREKFELWVARLSGRYETHRRAIETRRLRSDLDQSAAEHAISARRQRYLYRLQRQIELRFWRHQPKSQRWSSSGTDQTTKNRQIDQFDGFGFRTDAPEAPPLISPTRTLVCPSCSLSHSATTCCSKVKVLSQDYVAKFPVQFPPCDPNVTPCPCNASHWYQDELEASTLSREAEEFGEVAALEARFEKISKNLKIQLQNIPDVEFKQARFKAAVNLLKESRDVKETALRMKPWNEAFLDWTDEVEQEACDMLYGLFLFSLGARETCDPVRFDKDEVDESMEQYFGSLDHDDAVLLGPEDKSDAAMMFSCYLSRKVWSPVPWRKFGKALDGFIARVATTPVTTPVDEDALLAARLILKTLVERGPAIDEFRDVEPNAPSACIELGRSAGGKRQAMYIDRPAPITQYVTPTAIYTGGKIRVITVGSYTTSDYLWVNKHLGACFRKLECSVFGGDVTSWFEKVKERFQTAPGERYVSGDLENATDNFDRRITENLIDMYCDLVGLTEEDARKMKSFTTSCLFKVGRDFFEQLNGNMMGSEVSFPFLCIFSLTAFICKDRALMARLLRFPKKRFEILSKLRVGINGDDIVFPAKDAEQWLAGVRAVGGVPSRGKSLTNPYFFTINSELWSRDGKVFCARPSFLTAINDGRKYFVEPSREMAEYERCTLFKFPHIFDIVRRLKLNIPVAWGGLGLVKKFDPYESALGYLRAKFRRARELQNKWMGAEDALEEAAKKSEEVKALGPKVRCVVTKEMKKAYQRLYMSKRATWKLPVSDTHDDDLPRLARRLSEQKRTWLREEWDKLMVRRDECVFKLPSALFSQFYARPLPETSGRWLFDEALSSAFTLDGMTTGHAQKLWTDHWLEPSQDKHRNQIRLSPEERHRRAQLAQHVENIENNGKDEKEYDRLKAVTLQLLQKQGRL